MPSEFAVPMMRQDPSSELPAMCSPAQRAVSHMVKMRSRRFMTRPQALEALHPGLSVAPPATLVAIAAHLVDRESRSPRRWFGFGGEVNLLNARAALLLGRALRRDEIRRRQKTEGPTP